MNQKGVQSRRCNFHIYMSIFSAWNMENFIFPAGEFHTSCRKSVSIISPWNMANFIFHAGKLVPIISAWNIPVEIILFSGKWIYILILRHYCQKQKTAIRSHTCVESKRDTKEPICEAERDSQIQKLMDDCGDLVVDIARLGVEVRQTSNICNARK